METLLSLYTAPLTAILQLEPWLSHLIFSLLTVPKLIFAGWAFAKAGRSPLWAMFLLIPYTEVIALWVFAYIRWPFAQAPRPEDAAEEAPRA
jgi:hypothetical protein